MRPIFQKHGSFMSETPSHRSIISTGYAVAIAFVTVLAAFTTPNAEAQASSAFLPPVAYGTGGLDTIFPNTGGPIWITAADVNGDGRPDLLVANWCVTFSA